MISSVNILDAVKAVCLKGIELLHTETVSLKYFLSVNVTSATADAEIVSVCSINKHKTG